MLSPKIIKIAVLVLFLCATVSLASAEIIKSYVTDNAEIFSSEKRTLLEQQLKDLESRTNGVQLLVYIDNVIPADRTLEEYSLQIAEESKVGRQGSDNGVLLYVAVDDRVYRWEVGYGVEDVLNTPFLGRISREVMVPHFQEGDIDEGILRGISAVSEKLLSSEDEDVIIAKHAETVSEESLNLLYWVMVFTFVIGFPLLRAYIVAKSLRYIAKHKGSHNDAVYLAAATNLFKSGRFGGGSGGFSGGGGSFGGGGFSGKW